MDEDCSRRTEQRRIKIKVTGHIREIEATVSSCTQRDTSHSTEDISEVYYDALDFPSVLEADYFENRVALPSFEDHLSDCDDSSSVQYVDSQHFDFDDICADSNDDRNLRDDSIDSESGISDDKRDFAGWASQFNVSHSALSALLKIWGKKGSKCPFGSQNIALHRRMPSKIYCKWFLLPFWSSKCHTI